MDDKPSLMPPGGPEADDAGKPPVPTISRGQMLYENHCQACHTSILHIRDKRRAKSVAEIRQWVLRWSAELKLNWSQGDVEEVVYYLSGRYYHFSSPKRPN